MKRTLEPVDLMVMIGLCAILLGGWLFFISPDGLPEVNRLEPVVLSEPTDFMTGMYWLQPALGQAIVQQAVLERQGAAAIAASAAALHRARIAQESLRRSPYGHLNTIKERAAVIPAEHAGRIQEVMGRSIVNFTQRGVKAGGLSAATGDYNTGIIQLTAAWGKRMDDDFQADWQANLGRAIMTASQDRAAMSAQAEEAMAAALAQAVKVQTTYQKATESARAQLAAATSAAIRTEMRADLFAQLATAERMVARPSPMQATSAGPPKSSPDIPFGYITAAFIALVALFLGGLRLPSHKHEEKPA